ncbi:hypothetical protein EON63_23060 [archaeon]|nr:MAG: hypothetical protein EON63_23060 [archaeon]
MQSPSSAITDSSPTHRPPPFRFFQPKGVLGCYLSHHHFWQVVADSHLSHAVILEDDVQLAGGFENKLKGLVKEMDEVLGKDWDVVLLGAIGECFVFLDCVCDITIYIHVRTHIKLILTPTNTHTHTHTNIHTNIHTLAQTHVRIHTQHLHIHTHTHTHTHTHANVLSGRVHPEGRDTFSSRFFSTYIGNHTNTCISIEHTKPNIHTYTYIHIFIHTYRRQPPVEARVSSTLHTHQTCWHTRIHD